MADDLSRIFIAPGAHVFWAPFPRRARPRRAADRTRSRRWRAGTRLAKRAARTRPAPRSVKWIALGWTVNTAELHVEAQ